jgi:hypothetical protein
MKLELLVNHEEALRSLAQKTLSNTQTAWDLSESLDTAFGHIKRFGERRDELVKKMGTPGAEEGNFQITDLKTFNEELQKIVQVDVKIKFPSIPLTMFNGEPLSAADLGAWRAMKIITKK